MNTKNVRNERFANTLFLSRREIKDSQRRQVLSRLINEILSSDDVETLKYLCEKGWLLKIHSSHDGTLIFGFRHWRRQHFCVKIKAIDAFLSSLCFRVHKWLTLDLGMWIWIGQDNSCKKLERYGKFLSQNI
nr:hypothetical protein [Marseillevirus cajuinensis]